MRAWDRLNRPTQKRCFFPFVGLLEYEWGLKVNSQLSWLWLLFLWLTAVIMIMSVLEVTRGCFVREVQRSPKMAIICCKNLGIPLDRDSKYFFLTCGTNIKEDNSKYTLMHKFQHQHSMDIVIEMKFPGMWLDKNFWSLLPN